MGDSRLSPLSHANGRESGALTPLGVLPHARPIDARNGLCPHDPGIVPGRDDADLAGAHLELAAVLHHDVQPAGYLVGGMRRLAQFRPSDRLHVIGPLPAGLEAVAADAAAAHVNNFHSPLVERPNIIRRLQALLLYAGHGTPPTAMTLDRRLSYA